jgi:small subunit ribosomal protein S6
MKNYEALFILKPQADESIEKIASSITDTVKKNKGEIIKSENWGRKPLSFTIKKQKEGVYYKLDFSIDPSMIDKIEGIYKLNQDILRVQVIKR